MVMVMVVEMVTAMAMVMAYASIAPIGKSLVNTSLADILVGHCADDCKEFRKQHVRAKADNRKFINE